MRELLDNNPKQAPPINSSSYLRFEGNRVRVQAIIADEIDRLGVEQLLKSRGARILNFDHDWIDSEESQPPINETADVIVVSDPTPGGSIEELRSIIAAISATTPESRVLVITGIRSELEASSLLRNLISAPGDIYVRFDRIDSDKFLQAVRKLSLGIAGDLTTDLPQLHARLIETAALLQ